MPDIWRLTHVKRSTTRTTASPVAGLHRVDEHGLVPKLDIQAQGDEELPDGELFSFRTLERAHWSATRRMKKDRRRLGVAMMLGAIGLLAFTYLLSGYAGWFSWVLVAIAVFNFGQGLFWFISRGS